MKKMVGNEKNFDAKATFPRVAYSEDQNGESNKVSIEVPNALQKSECSQYQNFFVKHTPLQQVQPSFPRSLESGLFFDQNSYTQNVSSTQNSQSFSQSTYYRNIHQGVSERSHISHDHMHPRLKEMRARVQQLELYNNDLPNFPEVPPIYSLKHNQSTCKSRPINVVKALNESQNPPPSYSYLQSHTQVDIQSYKLTAERLRNGSMKVKYSATKPLFLKVSGDYKRLTCIFPSLNNMSPPEIVSIDVPNPYAEPDVDPEPVNRTPNENGHQQFASTPFQIKRPLNSPTNTVDEFNSCSPTLKQGSSFRKDPMTAPRSNTFGTSGFVPYNKETPRFSRTRSFHTDASMNTESQFHHSSLGAAVFENEESMNAVKEYSGKSTLEKDCSEIIENITKKVCVDTQCSLQQPLNGESLVETTCNDTSTTLSLDKETSSSPEESLGTDVKKRTEKEKSMKVVMEYSGNSPFEEDNSAIVKNITEKVYIDTQCTAFEKSLNHESLVETTCNNTSPALSVEKETSRSSEEFLDTDVKEKRNEKEKSVKVVMEYSGNSTLEKDCSEIIENIRKKVCVNTQCTLEQPLNGESLVETTCNDTSPTLSVDKETSSSSEKSLDTDVKKRTEKEKSIKVVMKYSGNSTLEEGNSRIVKNISEKAYIDTQCTAFEKSLNQESLVETTYNDTSPALSVEKETSSSSEEFLDTDVKGKKTEKEKSVKVVMEYSGNSPLEEDSCAILKNIMEKVYIDTQCTAFEKSLNPENLVETTCNDTSRSLGTGKKDIIAYANNNIEVKGDSDIVKKDLKGNNFDDVCLMLGTGFDQADLQETTYPDKNPVISLEEELFSFSIPCYNDEEATEFASHKRSAYGESSLKADSSKNNNGLLQNIPPIFEAEKSKTDSDKSIKVKINSDDAEKASNKKDFNPLCSTCDTSLNQKSFVETNLYHTSRLFSVELESILSSKDSETNGFISSTSSFGERIPLNTDSSKDTYRIFSQEPPNAVVFETGKPMNDVKCSGNSILIETDSDIVERALEKKSIDDALCTTLGSSLNQELKLSSIDSISNTLFEKENCECSGQNGKADALLEDYPIANKLKIRHKPKVTPKKRNKSFIKDSEESSPIRSKRVCTFIAQEHKTLNMESELSKLEQEKMNCHKKINDHNETLIKAGNTSSIVTVAPAEKEDISNNLSTEGVDTYSSQEYKTLIMESQFSELEQKNINIHKKGNNHNETLLKAGNTSSTVKVVSTKKEDISNNSSAQNEHLDFEMIDFSELYNLNPTFSTSLNQEFEMPSVSLISKELVEENIELNEQRKFETTLQTKENISRNIPDTMNQKEKFGSPIKASDQRILIQSIPLSCELFESEEVDSFCIPPLSFTKESPTSYSNGAETGPNSQPEINCADTNVISTKCNVVEIEVKTSPKSRKINLTRSKTTLLENSLETRTNKSRRPSTFDCCVIDDNRCSEVNSGDKLPLVMTEEYPESEQNDSDDASKTFINSIPKKTSIRSTRKRRRKAKFTVTKRRKKSSVAKESSTSSGIGSVFEDLEKIKFTNRNFKKNVDNLVRALVNPEHSLDTVQLIFHVIEYLRCTCKNLIINQNFRGNTSNSLPITEDCIVSTLFKIEETGEPEFQSLLDSTVTTIYNMVLGKEFEFPLYGLVSLCRVLTEICKRQINKIKPIQLCGELIKWQHQYAPYLIASVACIWQEIFQPSSYSDKEESIFFGAIALGVKNKPDKLSDSEWQQCQAIFSKVLSVKATENEQIPSDICVLVHRIGSKCLNSIYDNNFLLTTPLVIYTQVRGWEWIKEFLIEPFIVRSLKKYSVGVQNEIAFEYMINLYAEIRFYCPDKEDPYGLLTFYFGADTDYVHFTAALALLKLIMWKGDYFSEEILQWITKWSDHNKVTAIQPLFQRRMMRHKNFSIADIIEEPVA